VDLQAQVLRSVERGERHVEPAFSDCPVPDLSLLQLLPERLWQHVAACGQLHDLDVIASDPLPNVGPDRNEYRDQHDRDYEYFHAPRYLWKAVRAGAAHHNVVLATRRRTRWHS